MTSSPLVTVLVPTHNHDETLSYSVRSILDQTVPDLQVVIIGDGATARVRAVAEELCTMDTRVVWEDHPKSRRRGEPYRDAAIRRSLSRFVAYNCDDDLWFPHHLETMIETIADRDFVHPFPVLIGADGRAMFMPSDLDRPESVDWHLNEIPRNTISLSGVMHTREAYLRLPHGWRETPEGHWTDHYMWRQFFSENWFSGVTCPHATTLKLMAEGRDETAPGGRGADIERWWSQMHDPGFATEWDDMVRTAVWRSAVDHNLVSTIRGDELESLRRRTSALEIDLQESHAEHERRRSEVRSLTNELRALRESRSWRLTRPLRTIGRLVRRGMGVRGST